MLNRLIVIQPTSLCNLNCLYCYVPNRKNAEIMSDEVLESCAKVIFNSAVTQPDTSYDQDRLLVSWHAGEPLTAGIDFYKKAVAYFKRYNLKQIPCDMNIQTNATLVTQEWCDFFRENNFTVGISIDGPEFIHNHYRKDWNNNGSFKRAMRGVELLQKNKLAPNNICVLTDYSLDFPTEIYSFFKENNFTSVAFNIDEQEGTNIKSSYAEKDVRRISAQAVERYKLFLSIFFDLWQKDGKPFTVREFNDTAGKMFLFSRSQYKNFVFATESIAFANIGITRKGDIITFSPELASGTPTNPQEFVIGNIRNINAFEDLFNNANFKKQLQDIVIGVQNCAKECKYFDLCGGGSAANKFYEKGTFQATETDYCILTKKLIVDLLVNKMKEYSINEMPMDVPVANEA